VDKNRYLRIAEAESPQICHVTEWMPKSENFAFSDIKIFELTCILISVLRDLSQDQSHETSERNGGNMGLRITTWNGALSPNPNIHDGSELILLQ